MLTNLNIIGVCERHVCVFENTGYHSYVWQLAWKIFFYVTCEDIKRTIEAARFPVDSKDIVTRRLAASVQLLTTTLQAAP